MYLYQVVIRSFLLYSLGVALVILLELVSIRLTCFTSTQ